MEIEWQEPKSPKGTASAYTVTATGTYGQAIVSARWDVLPNSPAVGPGRVTITRIKTPESNSERGVSSPVLADAQRVITRMTQELPERVRGLPGIDPMDRVRELIRRLPQGPRANAGAYYPALLKVFRLIQETGVRNPVEVLSQETGRPVNTLNLHLRKARESESAE